MDELSMSPATEAIQYKNARYNYAYRTSLFISLIIIGSPRVHYSKT